MISVTCGMPPVTVPVLSSTAILTLPVFSSEEAVLKRIPFFAPTPLPTIIATGVARPRAQGQLMTSTEIALASENSKLLPISSQTVSVIIETSITAGTNTPLTLSASFAAGAFVAAASVTVFIICESNVS